MEEVKAKQKDIKNFISAVGRRRESVARIRLYKSIPQGLVFGKLSVKKGDIVVNGKAAVDYFTIPAAKSIFEGPLNITNTINKYAFTIRVRGGGISGQMGATVLAMSRALSKLDPQNRALLKKKGLLERDARTRQRRNVGMGGKSRRKKQSPKR